MQTALHRRDHHDLSEVAPGDPGKVLTREVMVELYGSHSSMFKDHTLGKHGHSDVD